MTAPTLDVVRLGPAEARAVHGALPDGGTGDFHVVRYTHPSAGWTLSIATHAAPGSHKLSLGGFRIAPRDRAESPGYSNDREAIGLALGMEGKIAWSRLIGCAGPRTRPEMHRLVGGKCVLLPTVGARVGEPQDAALLDFAGEALNAFVRDYGAYPVTGQDLGHGTMHDGHTASLDYLHGRYDGSVRADTSKPTGEGNVRLLLGALEALGIAPSAATVGLVGLGNIGQHVLDRLLALGTTVLAIEPDAARAARAAERGVRMYALDDKATFLAQPMDALVVNARGGTLDLASAHLVAGNARCRIVCGCENLAMPDATAADVLRHAHTAWFPTEFGGMMGYLTAAEEYLCAKAGAAFDVQALFDAAARLEDAGREITKRWLATAFEAPFARVAHEVFG